MKVVYVKEQDRRYFSRHSVVRVERNLIFQDDLNSINHVITSIDRYVGILLFTQFLLR